MNHKDLIEFDGKEISIEDLLNKEPNEVLVGLYIKVLTLSEKVKDVPKQLFNNSRAISWIKGGLAVLTAIIIGVGLKTFT